MRSRQAQGSHREGWLQGLAFAGALLIIVLVVYASVMSRRYREVDERLRTAIALPSARPISSSPVKTAPPLPTWSWTQLISAAQRNQDGTWEIPEAVGRLDPGHNRWRLPTPLFLGLTRWHREAVVPLLAESWEVSDYGLAYTFHLRRDVYWVRCDPAGREVTRVRRVTAEDVVFSIEQALRAQAQMPYAEALYPIVGAEARHSGDNAAALGVEALDPFTVRFSLVYPAEFFPGLLADPVAYLVPPEPIRQYGDAWETPGKIWVNGPFCPVAWTPGQSVTVLSNPWLPEEIAPTLEKIASGLLYPRIAQLSANWMVPETALVLDPAQAASDPALSQVIFLGLTLRSWDGRDEVPGLAESWEVAGDGRVYTFHLRHHVSWVQCAAGAGGTRYVRDVVADDVVAALERVLSPGTRTPDPGRLFPILGAQEYHRGLAAGIAGVEAVDPHTVRFTLLSPTVDLPLLLADPVVWPVPAEFARSEELRWSWADPGRIWVDGFFCPVSWEPGRAASLVRNPWLGDESVLASLGRSWGSVLPGPWLQWTPARLPSPSP